MSYGGIALFIEKAKKLFSYHATSILTIIIYSISMSKKQGVIFENDVKSLSTIFKFC